MVLPTVNSDRLERCIYVRPVCVFVPEVSGLRAQVFIHGVQGTHAAVFL